MEELKSKLLKGEVGLYNAMLEILNELENLSKKIAAIEEKTKSANKVAPSTTAKKKKT